MMTRDEFDAFCGSLTAATNVVQWEGASVWKVGGKMFAIQMSEPGDWKISFKVSDLAFEIMPEQPGLIPAPYLQRAKWIRLDDHDAMTRPELEQHLRDAHAIIAAKLSKKMQRELGLL
ncbi:MAG: MmcQ/YjbR family DNA-binding protein [Alphaproteobacteria bacterium]